MIRRAVLLAVLATVAHTGSARAQSTIGGGVYLTYGSTWLSASDSFTAVAGSSRVSSVGGGGTVTGIWQGLFVDVGVSRQKLEGQRVFVFDGTVYELGIPLEVTLRPIDVAAGWRLNDGRTSPYIGAGMTIVSYEEKADFAAAGDDLSERKSGFLVLGGVDVAVLQWLRVGGEIRYRAVTGVLGAGGVSDIYGEDSLGGVAVSVRATLGL